MHSHESLPVKIKKRISENGQKEWDVKAVNVRLNRLCVIRHANAYMYVKLAYLKYSINLLISFKLNELNGTDHWQKCDLHSISTTRE